MLLLLHITWNGSTDFQTAVTSASDHFDAAVGDGTDWLTLCPDHSERPIQIQPRFTTPIHFSWGFDVDLFHETILRASLPSCAHYCQTLWWWMLPRSSSYETWCFSAVKIIVFYSVRQTEHKESVYALFIFQFDIVWYYVCCMIRVLLLTLNMFHMEHSSDLDVMRFSMHPWWSNCID